MLARGAPRQSPDTSTLATERSAHAQMHADLVHLCGSTGVCHPQPLHTVVPPL